MADIKEITTNFLGIKIVVNKNDITGKIIINGGIPEEEAFRRFIKEINKGNIMIDIGACYGQYTLTCAKLVNKVIAIEPNPYHFKMLKKGIELNNLKNVIPLNIALSDSHDIKDLFMSNNHLEGTSLFEEKLNEELKNIKKFKMKIHTTTLDKLLLQLNIDHNKINIIKMDVEGAEMKILKGAQKVLNESKNLKLLTEFGAHAISASGEKPIKFLNLLIDRFPHVEIVEKRILINKNNVDIHSKIVCTSIFCK